MKNIDFKEKKVLMRVDFNVPLDENQQITDDTRIVKALPTIKYVLEHGASIILMSHLGRPQKKRLADGNIDVKRFSLRALVQHLESLLGTKVDFADDCIGIDARIKADSIQPGEVLILENTRFHAGESKGDESMAYKLAKLGDIYINDAFGTAHRAHASTTTVAKFFKKKERAFGFLIEAEIKNADILLKSPKRPVTAIVGGAKVSDKIKLLDRLLESVENLIIGGGMAYTFIKAQGGNIGKSLCEPDYLDLANELITKADSMNVDIYLPQDSVIAEAFDNNASYRIAASDEIPDSWLGLDIGPEAIASFSEVIYKSKSILWNGPQGVFEMSNFSKGTFAIAAAIAEATENGAFSLIGGGDSVAAVNQSGLADKVSFISTGGGAMLEYLEGKILPGIQAILADDEE